MSAAAAFADSRALVRAHAQNPSVVAMHKMQNGQLCVMQSTAIPRGVMNHSSQSRGSLRSSSSASLMSTPSRATTSGLSSSKSNGLLTSRRDASSLDAFVLSRPGFMSTHEEHTWYGSRPSVHPRGKRPTAVTPTQSMFSISAYKHGLIKPSAHDAVVDRTVTEFTYPHPSQKQRLMASRGFRDLGEQWGEHVQHMHAKDMALSSRMQQSSLRRSQTAFASFGMGL